MESKIDQTSYNESDNAMAKIISDEKKKGESLGCGLVLIKLDENRRLCKMGYNIPDNCTPNIGDLIEIKRLFYDHWAVYVGDGKVIHVRNGGDAKATIKLDILKNVCGKSLCRINNLEKAAQERELKPRSVDTILDHANDMLGKMFEYHPINNNCEHFATNCRFGLSFSQQALTAKEDPTGFTEMAVDVIMENKSIMNDLTEKV
jgi:hypothetical protein